MAVMTSTPELRLGDPAVAARIRRGVAEFTRGWREFWQGYWQSTHSC